MPGTDLTHHVNNNNTNNTTSNAGPVAGGGAVSSATTSTTSTAAPPVLGQSETPIKTKVARRLQPFIESIHLFFSDLEIIKNTTQESLEEKTRKQAVIASKSSHDKVEQERAKLKELERQLSLDSWYRPLKDKILSPDDLLESWSKSSDCSLENKELLPVCYWYNDFKTRFSSQFNPKNIIALAQLEFYNPARFCAFLLWLLDDPDNATFIIESGLLHHFFAQHCAFIHTDESEFRETYALLNQLRDVPAVKSLLDCADKVYFSAGGVALNRPVEIEGRAVFESANLTGGRFTHDTQLSNQITPLQRLPQIIFPENPDDIVQLYHYFGVDMLPEFDFEREADRHAFNVLLVKTEQMSLCEALPELILTEKISVRQAVRCLNAMAQEMQKQPDVLNELIQQNPFYIYLYSTINIDDEQLAKAIKKLWRSSIENKPFHSVSLLLWIDFYRKLKNKNGDASVLMSETLSDMHQCILAQIVSCPTALPDEVLTEARSIELPEQGMLEFLRRFKIELTQSFIPGNFEAMNDKWGELRARVYNLIDIRPSLRYPSTHYPADNHQLKAFYIEMLWRNAPSQFNIPATPREALETLLFTHEPALQQRLIEYLEHQNIQWVNPTSDDDKPLLEKAALQGNLVLVQRILALTGGNEPSQESVYHALSHAAQAGRLNIVTHILGLTGDNRPSQNGVSVILQNAAHAGQWNIVTHILGLTGDNRPSQNSVFVILQEAAHAGQWNIVTHIFGLTGDNKPSQKNVSVILWHAAHKGRLNIVTHILGLTGDNKHSQDSVSDTLFTAAGEGHLHVVTYILGLTGDNKPNQDSVSDALSYAADMGHWDVVIHILGLTGDNKPSQESISEALSFAADMGQWNVVIHILGLTGDNKPSQDNISDALECAIANNHSKIATDLRSFLETMQGVSHTMPRRI